MDEDITTMFHWADYAVFSFSLALGLAIGFVFVFTGGKQKSKEEYLLGNKKLNVISVGISMLASNVNAVFLLGATAEVSYRGAIYLLIGLSQIPITLLSIYVYVPLWRRIQVTSAYEYLDKRYNSLGLRLWGAFLFSLQTILFLSVVLYAPAMALGQVTGLNLHVAIIVCGAVCAVYTVFGGIKAVVWTDTVQIVIMVFGVLLINIMAIVHAGGVAPVLQTAKDIGRLNFNNFSFDPRERHTVWSLIIGFTFTYSLNELSNQMIVQRYMAVENTANAQQSVIVHKVMAVVCVLLVAVLGIIVAVHYKDCDPLVAGQISAGDQLLPYFIMDILAPYHGLPGLFIAAIFAAALSTVSSSINSLSAVFLIDFVQPLMKSLGKPMPPKQEHIYAKLLAGIFGILSIALSYLAPLLGPVIIQIPPTVTGVVGGPLYSLFFLGFFVPWANKWGAVGGSVLGLCFTLWISVGAILYRSPIGGLQVGMCNITEAEDLIPTTISTLPSSTVSTEEAAPMGGLYDISYLWLGTVSVFGSILPGVFISALVNLFGYGGSPESYESNLLWPYRTHCCTKYLNLADHTCIEAHNSVHERSDTKPSELSNFVSNNSKNFQPSKTEMMLVL